MVPILIGSKMRSLCFSFILVSLSFQALAVDFYDAEILIFQQTLGQEDNEELEAPRERHVDLLLELHQLLDKQPVVYLEPAIDGYLTDVLRKVKSTNSYNILFHGQWSQTTSNRKTAPYIVLHLPEIDGNFSLTGVLRLFSTDLLYVDLLLRYQPAMDSVNAEIQSETTMPERPHYFLKERRRIKFREIHFIDHPRFGAILTVSPVTVEK